MAVADVLKQQTQLFLPFLCCIAVGTRVTPGPRADPDVRANASGSYLRSWRKIKETTASSQPHVTG